MSMIVRDKFRLNYNDPYLSAVYNTTMDLWAAGEDTVVEDTLIVLRCERQHKITARQTLDALETLVKRGAFVVDQRDCGDAQFTVPCHGPNGMAHGVQY